MASVWQAIIIWLIIYILFMLIHNIIIWSYKWILDYLLTIIKRIIITQIIWLIYPWNPKLPEIAASNMNAEIKPFFKTTYINLLAIFTYDEKCWWALRWVYL